MKRQIVRINRRKMLAKEVASVNFLIYTLELSELNLILYKKRWNYTNFNDLADYVKESLVLLQEVEELVFYKFRFRDVKNVFRKEYKLTNDQAWNMQYGFLMTLCSRNILARVRPRFIKRCKLLKKNLKKDL